MYMEVHDYRIKNDEYDKYLSEHIENVSKGYRWLKANLPEIFEDVPKFINMDRIIADHDKSKYSDSEYDAYADYFYGDEKTDSISSAFNVAWLHHIHNNPHHWQHWLLHQDDGPMLKIDMPIEYIIEMICDHWAFSWKKNNLYEIFSWYEKKKDNIEFSDKTREIYEDILAKLHDKLDSMEDPLDF